MSEPGKRPLILRILGLYLGLFDPESTTRSVEIIFSLLLTRGPMRSKLSRIMSRPLAAKLGRVPGESDYTAALEEFSVHFARMLTSMLTVDPDAPTPPKTSHVSLDVLPALKKAMKKGKGVILVSPHFGNLVLAKVALALSGIKLHMLFIHAGPYKYASAIGITAHDLGESAAPLLAALRANETIFLESDIEYFPDERVMDFFGDPIRPPHGPARLSQASGAPIIPCYMVSKDGSHRLVHDDPIYPEGRTQEEIESAILNSQERWLSRYPEQWFVFQDIWDLKGAAAANNRRLKRMRAYRRVLKFFRLYP